ncbi:MAG TPA: hypothetical protein VLQ93_01035 [Myxococcaceae bacterium]|nr:hypothetical protein [Myxococcaceae bacterium]
MLRLTVLAGLALLAAPAQAAHCNSLFAAYVAGRAGMTDCGTHFTVDSAPCVANETADQCATRVYNDAESLTLAPGSGAMTAKWLAPCLDGTNTCPQRELVCYDGTRPMVYVDKAVDMNGGEMYSNGWVFFMGGEGGPCTGDSCWDY